MIQAFGDFVVSGDFVVGFVVFLVITLIQFIVVAKGAERVSEVAARFTLDALPGKQMSIDADLRAGIIDVTEAKFRRDYLQRESQFYGAMDGAMKFVKGDAIAGIVISIVNIAAGLAIGVSRGMAFGEAARTYTLLTVGDGLVSQIPSLVIAITSGMITTRVAANAGGEAKAGEETSLGKEIGAQMLAQPKALAIASVTFVLLGVVPGLPTIPFLVLGGLGGGLAWVLFKNQKLQAALGVEARVAEAQQGALPVGPEGQQLRLPVSTPVIVETSPMVTTLVDTTRNPRFIEQLIPEMREWMFQDMGVFFPGVKVRGDAGYLEENSYTIHVNEVPAATGLVYPDCVFATAELGQFEGMGLDGIPAQHPSMGSPGLWVQQEHAEQLQAAAAAIMRPEEFMAVHLAHVLKKNVDQLLGIQDVQNMLDLLEQQGYETLVTTVVPKLVSVQKLTDVLKRLLQEDISIKNMRRILEALADWAPYENDPVYLTEYVRMGLKQYIAYKVTAGHNMLSAYVVDPQIEQAIEGGIRQSASGSSLSLDPEASQAILAAFRGVLGEGRGNGGGARVIVLTQMEVRYFLRRLLEFEYPDVTVLSFQELPSDLQIQPIGRVEMATRALGPAEVS